MEGDGWGGEVRVCQEHCMQRSRGGSDGCGMGEAVESATHLHPYPGLWPSLSLSGSSMA